MRVLFMGTPAFALPPLAALAARHELAAVVTRVDRGRGRGRRTELSAVKQWALDAGVPIEQPETLRSEESQARIGAYEADAIVVVAFGMILPAAVLDMPPLGCINVHASLLPRHRGAAPVAWAILAGDDETGVTTMQMDEGLDTGPVLLQARTPVGARETTPEIAGRLAEVGAGLLVETLDGLAAGTLAPQPQDDAAATLAPSFKKGDGVVDWAAPAIEIDRRVRALQPWPGSFTYRGEQRLTLWRLTPHPGAGDAGEPAGLVVGAGPGGVEVACGAGDRVTIDELQRAGGRRQDAAEFVRGRQIAAGDVLGPQHDSD